MLDLSLLNEKQQEAVCHFEGPLLILAGAGSGKTRVLTYRIAWLIEEKGVEPWNILAITFTNKAAEEMRSRVDQMTQEAPRRVWTATFHSTCVRILRRHIDRLGYGTNFTIYDTDDQRTLMKDICKRLNIDTKRYNERMILNAISRAKDELISPQEYAKEMQNDRDGFPISLAYTEYQRMLVSNNALDFDDLIGKTVELFRTQEDVLVYYQERFRFILVDEYQDTNLAQFELIRLLAGAYRNLCVVGDDDQSIYKFRGADIRNILDFERFFPDTRVVRLEQNYRSTQNILNAANEVIRNNKGRKGKTLWTANGSGEAVRVCEFQNAFEEAEFITGEIEKEVRTRNGKYADHAILYRTNAQSRMFEEKMLAANIPYKIIGGVNFYARKEIKDLLAYLKTIDNGKDDLAVRRIINIPRRGIGDTTLAKVQTHAAASSISFYEALLQADTVPGLGRSLPKIRSFVNLISTLKSKQEFFSVRELLKDVIDQTGYVEELKLEGTEEAKDRIGNIDELLNRAAIYDEEHGTEGNTLSGFLEELALVADIDSLDESEDYVVLMTIHSAKGLEFPVVYLAGMEEDLFPSYLSASSGNPSDLEEERRLCYVGITRAMRRLTFTWARSRMVRGDLRYHRISRFLEEIPEELLQSQEDAAFERFLNRAGRGRDSAAKTASKAADHPDSLYQQNTPYRQARSAFHEKAYVTRQFEVKKGGALDYEVGDTVRHVKFGTGIVTSIVEGGRDYEVTVDFEKAGTKKMFAAFAKLQKV